MTDAEVIKSDGYRALSIRLDLALCQIGQICDALEGQAEAQAAAAKANARGNSGDRKIVQEIARILDVESPC